MKPALNLLAIAGGVASGFVVMIWTGFHLEGRPAPSPINDIFPVAAVVLVLAIGWLIWLLATSVGEWVRQPRYHSKSRAELLAEREAWEREQRERLARMKADPALAPYAARIEAGEHWSDGQIAYDLDPAATATCAHLTPVERAMRAAGVVVRPQTGETVYATCTIDETELRRRFGLAPPAWYGELRQVDERGFEDRPAMVIGCHQHGTTIFVVEPAYAAPGTPQFP
jgi:hypothetical protein